jgi:quercetin dioxygenase-like cupin family protein
MKKIASIVAAAVCFGVACFAAAPAQTQDHVISAPGEAQWGPAPPLLPAGAQIAVLTGDPTKSVPYTVRLKFPAHYSIPAHSHPTDEHVVVVSGAVTFGMGKRLVKDVPANKTLPPGGFALMPARMNHFAYTGDEEATIVLYGMGPVEFTYVNPGDDPRHAKAAVLVAAPRGKASLDALSSAR